MAFLVLVLAYVGFVAFRLRKGRYSGNEERRASFLVDCATFVLFGLVGGALAFVGLMMAWGGLGYSHTVIAGVETLTRFFLGSSTKTFRSAAALTIGVAFVAVAVANHLFLARKIGSPARLLQEPAEKEPFGRLLTFGLVQSALFSVLWTVAFALFAHRR